MGHQVALYTHQSHLEHINDENHPERPARIRSVLEATKDLQITLKDAPLAQPGHIEAVHSLAHCKRVEQTALSGGGWLDRDTFVSPVGFEAASRAVGAAIAAVRKIVRDELDSAFVAARPPGHHAPIDPEVQVSWSPVKPTLGFCLFNTAAAAARYATDVEGLRRVAVVDVDAHHGNGTQDIFWHDARVLYSSIHQFPFYPGTGASSEVGATNNIFNLPLPAGSGTEVYDAALDAVVERVKLFDPELIVLSAGFDADERDPLCHMRIGPEFFGRCTTQLRSIAPIVATLEGGYDLAAVAEGSCAVVQALIDHAQHSA